MNTDSRAPYLLDEATGVFYRPDAEAPDSFDSSAEKMLTLLSPVREKHSFSRPLGTPLRSHLLRPFSGWFKGKKILELGCGGGFGAITRFLAESGGEVTAVGGSRQRAAVSRLRCEGMENVAVYCDGIFDLPFAEGSFDCVTLIGVLEYARMFSDSRDPVLETLRRARSLLTEDGVLFLAINNQLGLRYLAGMPEDRAGRVMFGVNDMYRDKSFATFTRNELEESLAKAGFAGRELFLPLPDCTGVEAVLHPSGLACGRGVFDPTQLIIKSIPPIWPSSCTPLFSMERAVGVMVRGNLTRDLANSFLFVASRHPDGANLVEKDILATHYGKFIAADYAKQAVFRLREDGSIIVERSRLAEPVHDGSTAKAFAQNIENEPFQRGESVHLHFLRTVNTPRWTVKDLALTLKPWIDWLRDKAAPDESGVLFLPPEYMDASPGNVIITDEGFAYIDREWSMTDQKTEFSYVVFRCLFDSLYCVSTVAEPAPGTDVSLVSLALRIMVMSKIAITAEERDAYLLRGTALGAQVSGEAAPPIEKVKELQLVIRPF